jgi:hypothetical protein
MANFLDTFKSWMTTSSSILGVAVAGATGTAATTGALSWRDAIVPLVGSVISILLPQRAGAIIGAVPQVVDLATSAQTVLADVNSSISKLQALGMTVTAPPVAAATPTAPAPTVATSLLALAPAVTQAVALADPQAAPTVSALATMGSAIQGLLGAVQGLASAHAAVVASVPTATPAVAPAPVPAAPVASITIAEKPAPV